MEELALLVLIAAVFAAIAICLIVLPIRDYLARRRQERRYDHSKGHS